jgi:hypothetical protein
MPLAPDEYLRQQRLRISAVRAYRLTTELHAPTQKVTVSHPLLQRGERHMKGHGTAAARHPNVHGEQKGLGWIWVYGALRSKTWYTSYQMQ